MSKSYSVQKNRWKGYDIQSSKYVANKDITTLRRRVRRNWDPNNGNIRDKTVKK